MTLNILNTIILLGSLQGFIFSFLLFSKTKKETAEKILATMLLFMALASLNIYLSESVHYWQVGVFLSLVPTILIMPIGPLTYFYLRFLMEPSLIWKRKYWTHFLTVIVDLLPVITGWALGIGFWLNSFDQDYLLSWGNVIDQYNTYTDIPRWVSITVYLLLVKWHYKKLRANLDDGKNKLSAYSFLWIGRFLNVFIAFQFIWLLFLIPYIIPSSRFTVLASLGYYPIYIPLTVLIYVLGIKGYFLARNQVSKFTEHQSIQLSQQQIEKLERAIIKAMEEDKLYLEPDLDLRRLVDHIDSDQRTVSYILNQHLSNSFNAFINYYRVEEVKQRMVMPGNEHLKLSGIAYEAGFNSQSTFQRAFKQLTKLSPKEYLAKQNRL
ncbi:MAG: helix-turn-helix domain-containing protein [Bacteroidota bacterium]